MRLHENIDFTTLTWVKPELDETLRQARNALQSYVEEGENPGELRTCSDLLHQVQGTLRMVELYGAAMVAEEMEQLAKALIDSKVDHRDNAYAVLMQGIVQLPDYLERLQSGHRDIPIVLLPLLNQLRESRGEKGLNESVLFSPDLSRPLPPSAQGPLSPLDQSELSRRAETLRGLFQGALLRWLKDDNSPATIRDLTDVCEQLVPITWAEPARRLFWVAAGTLDALGKNAFPISNPLKQALAKVEREIKRLADGGDAAFRSAPPIELTKQLLYFVAHEGSDTGRIGEIRQVFGLSGTEPSESELAHARGSLSGNNRALLETVAVAIKEDLLRVKDALDLHLRTPGASLAELGAQVDALDRVADTLGMLGLGVPRRVVQDQRTAINDVVSGQRQDDEETLLDIAGALLYVEAALDDQVERLGKEDSQASESIASGPSSESRRLLEVLVKEAIVNFAQARQSFVAFVETHWDHAQLAEVPRLLTEVAGALRILNIPEPADYLIGVRQFTDNELLRRRQVPNGQQMDRLADALASLEYFLEALRDRRPNREQILDVARQSLTSLGYWPLSAEVRSSAPLAAPALVAAAPAPAPAPVATTPAPAMPAPVVLELPAADPTPAALELPAADPTPAASVSASPTASPVGALVPGFDGTSSEEIDDEIREVFLEELEEEIDNLAQLLPSWRQEPANAELLRPIRRVFHTLKGSGRLVGAKTLGDFSWKVESLLNRVLDGSRPASPQVLALVQLVLESLPLLRAALQGQKVHADLEGIQATAEQLTVGKEVSYATSFAQEAEFATAVDAPSDQLAAELEPQPERVAEDTEETTASDQYADPMFSIDPVLLEILKPEVAGHLEVVDAWLADCAARGPQPVTDPLLRSIHTMNGAFAMTEVVLITDVTAPLEGFVKRALAHHLNPGIAGVALVADAAKAIRATIAAIEKPHPVLPHFDELSARATALRDTLPDSVLPSMPVHAEEDTAIMPQVVVLEAADVSAIPQFEIAAEATDSTDAEATLAVADETAPSEAEDLVELVAASEPEAVETMAAEGYLVAEPEAEFAAEPESQPVAAELEGEATTGAEFVQGDVVVEYAELPESEMLSLEAFLRESGENVTPFLLDEASPAPEPSPVDVEDVAALGEQAQAPETADVAALARMIAAAEPFTIDEVTLEQAVEAEIFTAEEQANAGELLADEEQIVAADVVEPEEVEELAAAVTDAEPEPRLVAISDEYYGMSLAELEALTAPDAEALAAPEAMESPPVVAAAAPEATEQPLVDVAAVESPAELAAAVEDNEADVFVEADGFANLPMITDLPAWTGAGEEAAISESKVDTPVATDGHVAEPAIATQAMPDAEDLPAEPEPVTAEAATEAEQAEDDDELFNDEPVEDELLADEPQQTAEAASHVEPVHSVRPSVPMAQDATDPETDLDVTDLDTELLDLFLEESNDILDHSDGMLARLRDHAEDRDSIINLQRDLHTLKGGARMAGIYAVGELGHAMESLLESVAEGRQRLDATGVVVLERGFDRLHAMVARIGERKAIALPTGLIAQVEALSEGKSLSSVVTGEAARAADASPQRFAAVESPTLEPLSAPVDELAAEDELTGVRAPQEQVRIRADLLDRLVNYAGEVAIYRARLEQQLGAFRANLGELDQTTSRLREQLRRLDIETEAQIIARYQREGEANDERFDPLELDRFTNQQQLTRGLNESANDLVNLQGVLDELTRQYETLLLQQSRVSSDLQEGLMRTRMVPFDALVPRLRRVLRQAAIDTGKQVQLKVDGASGEMDRNVLDRMTAPLEHMLRNAMAHGLELPEERRKVRKAEEGTVRIAVQREGSEVVLKVTDDGRGLNKQAIRDKALERGLIKADADLSDAALYSLILESGFSTAETVSRLSGRGVGMDVVYSEIRQLGGTLQINSVEGKGSEFVIRLPFTLAVTQAVFVKIGDTSFAVPIASVRGVGRIARADLDKQLASENPVFSYAGEDYAIHDLGTLIGHAPAKAQDSLQMPLLLARSGDLRTAISIDQVLGSREIVVKPVGPQVNSVPGIFGATIMGDGRVVVILDVAPLVRRHSAVVRDKTPVVAAPVVAAHRVPVVMVVDDSITMRKVTGRVLERNNMEVLTAKDGVDAVEKMAERVPDLVLLDIEMPRMDGYEVAQNMRSDPRLKDVPIIMITSRTGEKHRQRAMDIGVNRYLGKPYQELELMRNVFEMLGMEAVND